MADTKKAQSEYDLNVDTKTGTDLSREEKKQLARVYSPKREKGDFSVPKDGFISTDPTSLACLACCIGVSILMVAMCGSDDEYVCSYPATSTFVFYALSHLTLIAKGTQHRRSTPVVLALTILFGVLVLTPDYNSIVVTPSNIPTEPNMRTCDWFTHTFGTELYDCNMHDVPVYKLRHGPYHENDVITLTDLQIIYQADGAAGYGTDLDGGYYTGGNATSACSIAYHEALCGVYFPRCSDSCEELKPCRHVCDMFTERCGDAGVIIYPALQTFFYDDEWEQGVSRNYFDFYHDVTRKLVDCDNTDVWEQDPNAMCDNRTYSSGWNVDDGEPVCTTQYRDNYLAELENSHGEIVNEICDPPDYVRAGMMVAFALCSFLVLLWDYVIGDVFNYGTIHEFKWLSIGKMRASPTIPFAIGSYIVLFVTCTVIAAAVESNGQHGYAMVSYLVPMFSWTMLTTFCRPEGQGDEDAIDLARPVPKWARRAAPYISILGSVMMLIGMVIALVIENDVLATIASVLAVVATFGSKSMQFYRADIYGLSGQDFWVSLFLMEIAEVAVQVVNISVVTAPTRDRTILLVATALLGSNLIITPWLLVQDNVWFKTTAAVAFDCLLDLTIATYNAIAVVKVGSDDINTAGMLAIFYPIFMSALLLDSILHSYITWGGPLEAHRARMAMQEKMEQAKMRRRTKKYKEYEERLKKGNLSPTQRRRLSQRVSRRKSLMEKRYGDATKDARRTTFKIWADLADRLKVTLIGKLFLYFISLCGVVATVSMFVIVFVQESKCKDEYGSCVYENLRPRIYFPDGIFNQPRCGAAEVLDLYASGCGLTEINPNVRDFSGVFTMDFSNNEITYIPQGLLESFYDSEFLTSINLENNPLDNAPFDLFQLARNGINVNLENTQITTADWSNRSLTSLMESDGGSPVLEQLSNLLTLNVSHNSLTDITRELLPDATLGKAGWTPNLQVLDLSHNQLESVAIDFFDNTAADLNTIYLEHNLIRVAPTIWGTYMTEGPTRWCEVGTGFEFEASGILPDSACCSAIQNALEAHWDDVGDVFLTEPIQSDVDAVCAISDQCAKAYDRIVYGPLGVRGDYETGNCYNISRAAHNCGTSGSYDGYDPANEMPLRTLTIGNNPITELLFVRKKMRAWIDISELNSLLYVTFDHNYFDEYSIENSDIVFPNSTISVGMKANRFLRSGAKKIIEALYPVESLRALYMQLCGLDDDSVGALNTLMTSHPELRTLKLSGNRWVSMNVWRTLFNTVKEHYWIQNFNIQSVNFDSATQIALGDIMEDLKTPLLRIASDYNPWTTEGCVAMGHGIANTNLYQFQWYITTIDINFQLDDACGQALADGLKNSSLPVFYKIYMVGMFNDTTAYAWRDAFVENEAMAGMALFGHTGAYSAEATKDLLQAVAESGVVYAAGLWDGSPWTYADFGFDVNCYEACANSGSSCTPEGCGLNRTAWQEWVDNEVQPVTDCPTCGLMLSSDQEPGLINYVVDLDWNKRYCRPYASALV